MMRTLFLQAPSYDGFDGGAGARYQMRREIQSFWYPTWLAQPAALIDGSKLIDAPPHRIKLQDITPEAAKRDLVVLHTSTPSFSADVKTAEALKAIKPGLKIGMIGAKVAVEPDATLKASRAIDFVARNEFDYTIKEVAEGRDDDAGRTQQTRLGIRLAQRLVGGVPAPEVDRRLDAWRAEYLSKFAP